jgi:hypothetical protein
MFWLAMLHTCMPLTEATLPIAGIEARICPISIFAGWYEACVDVSAEPAIVPPVARITTLGKVPAVLEPTVLVPDIIEGKEHNDRKKKKNIVFFIE